MWTDRKRCVICQTLRISQLLWPVKSSDSMHDLLFLVLSWLISPQGMAGTVYQFPPSVKVRSGDTVSMHCRLNEVQSFCHTVAWVRVNPVTGIIDILQDANIPPQIKDEVENPVCRASIYNATAQDSGTYYCIATDREHMYLGNGTAVTVHGSTQADSTVMPSVDIVAFASSNDHSTVTLQCTVGGSAPSQVFVYWLIGSRKENGQTLVVWEENSVKTQNYVAVSAEEWRIEGQSTCVVKFGGWMFNTTLHHYDIQDICYPLVGVTRFFALVAALLFFVTSLILAGRF